MIICERLRETAERCITFQLKFEYETRLLPSKDWLLWPSDNSRCFPLNLWLDSLHEHLTQRFWESIILFFYMYMYNV